MKYSEDAAKDGGNLGWRTRQMLNGVFADAAFKLATSPWSTVDKRKGKMTPAPIKTGHGYHLILVEDKKA
jgi:NIMA-interacting peptidyl-prolyl cis-trans isomerase 4